MALPLGFTSQCELAEIWLTEDLPKNEIESRLIEAAPPGVKIIQIEVVEPIGPKLPNLIESADYEITLLEDTSHLAERIEKIRTADSIIQERRGKDYDLRPLIETIEEIDPDPQGKQRLHLRLAARTGATGRPDEVLTALAFPPSNARVHRTNLIFKTASEPPVDTKPLGG